MSKFSGMVGFWIDNQETAPDVWSDQIVEKPYVGDVLRNIRKFQAESDQQNENLVLNNQISIIADLYMKGNYPSIRYVLWNGIKWKVSSVTIQPPRAILEIGGVYKE